MLKNDSRIFIQYSCFYIVKLGYIGFFSAFHWLLQINLPLCTWRSMSPDADCTRSEFAAEPEVSACFNRVLICYPSSLTIGVTYRSGAKQWRLVASADSEAKLDLWGSKFPHNPGRTTPYALTNKKDFILRTSACPFIGSVPRCVKKSDRIYRSIYPRT